MVLRDRGQVRDHRGQLSGHDMDADVLGDIALIQRLYINQVERRPHVPKGEGLLDVLNQLNLVVSDEHDGPWSISQPALSRKPFRCG